MRDFETNLTQEYLKSILHYELDTGLWYWLITRLGIKINTIAGAENKAGYVLIGINGFKYRAHRLAWFYIKGEWPTNQLDHKNTIRNDNSWLNLRDANNQLNQANTNVSKNNSLGFKGVYPHINKRTQTLRYRAKLNADGKQIHLGTFDTPEQALEAYRDASIKAFGEYARS